MAGVGLGYEDLPGESDDSYVLVRRGRSSTRKAEVALLLGLFGSFATVVLAPGFAGAQTDVAAVPFILLVFSGMALTIGAFGFGWARARRSRLIEQPRRIAIERGPGQPYLQIGRRTLPTSEVVRIEVHEVPVAHDDGRVEHRYVVGIVLRSQVVELGFDSASAAQSVALTLAARLGVAEPVVRLRPLFRGYGFVLALPIMLGISAPVASGVWMFTLDSSRWQATLFPIGAVLLANLVVFLLTWLLGRPAVRSYLAKEYADGVYC